MADPSTPSQRLQQPFSPAFSDTTPSKLSFRSLETRRMDWTGIPPADWIDRYHRHVKVLAYQWVSNAYRAYTSFARKDKLHYKDAQALHRHIYAFWGGAGRSFVPCRISNEETFSRRQCSTRLPRLFLIFVRPKRLDRWPRTRCANSDVKQSSWCATFRRQKN